MPLYEYLCGNAHRTVQIRSIALPLTELEMSICDECKEPAELVPSRTGRPILIGHGFHEVDYQHGKLGT